MAACPNCGRRTLRTKDWVCQWCGYPLLGGGYKPIDKTYKELQEERNPSFKSEDQESEPEYKYKPEPEPEPEPDPKPEPGWKIKKAPKPSYQSKPRIEPELEPEPEIQPEPRPVIQPEARKAPPPVSQPRMEPSRPKPVEPVLLPKTEPAPQLQQPVALSQPELPPRPEPPVAPQPEAITVPSLGSITNGTQLSIDQIDALFRADIGGAHEALKEKTIVVKGFVNKVFIRDHLEIRYLILTGARKVTWSARCQFDKENSPAMSRLSEGQAVAMKAKYDGYSKNIIFKECALLASN
jgi:hypothetical protein